MYSLVDKLISKEYQETLRSFHENKQGFGTSGATRHIRTIVQLFEQHKIFNLPEKLYGKDAHERWRQLDYGCGKGTLKQSHPFAGHMISTRFLEYDPAIPGKDRDPGIADMIYCLDVLEHVEPEKLDDVLLHIESKLRGRNSNILFYIQYTEALTFLPDGRNAHLIVEDHVWWFNKLKDLFRMKGFLNKNNGGYFLVGKHPDRNFDHLIREPASKEKE
jgi:hypothetical protein